MDFSTDEVNYQILEKWKGNVKKLLFSKNVCSICLEEQHDLKSWDEVYCIKSEVFETEQSLQEIIKIAFGVHFSNMLPTKSVCNKCITIILNTFRMVMNVTYNHEILNKYIDIIAEEMRTTEEILDKVKDHECYLNINDEIKSVFGIKKRINRTDSEPDSDDSEMLKYECPYCELKTNNLSSLKNHYKRSHAKESCFECPKCPRMFTTLNILVKHRNTAHRETISYCNECTIILCNVDEEEHVMQDHRNKFMCDTCGQEFDTKATIIEHMKENHETYLNCQYCFKRFASKYKLIHHRCLYKCLECKNECLHEKYLLSYRDQYLAGHKVFKCPDCTFTYKGRNQLISHANEAHLKRLPYLCDLCGEKFASNPSLRIHKYKIHENDVSVAMVTIEGSNIPHYQCTCGSLFNSEEKYTTHRKKHFDDMCQCQFCSKVFRSIATLNMHLKTNHLNQKDGYGTHYQCTMCALDFNFKMDYSRHLETHSEDSLHICRVCKNKFRSKVDYYSHLRKHQFKYNSECHICFKKYTKNTISRHIKRHMSSLFEDNSPESVVKLKKSFCHSCGVTFTNNKALIQHNIEIHKEKKINKTVYGEHLKIHAKTKLKSCPECDYSTKSSSCLEAHINKHHLNVRPYECYVCNKKFYGEHTLRSHGEVHSERSVYLCTICSKKCISKKALMLHTRIHTGEKPYQCDLCDLRFLSSSRRKHHRDRNHFEPSIQCEICQKMFYTRSDLGKHLRGHVS